MARPDDEGPTEPETTGPPERRRLGAQVSWPTQDQTLTPEAVAKAPTAAEAVAVIGLGRFGGQVADTLRRLGHDVLGIDTDLSVVQRWSDQLRHVVQADATDAATLRQLGVADLNRVVVGIGTGIEASVLTVLTLVELGVREIWAKAISAKHGKILSVIGAARVIYPEVAVGDRVAHLITTQMLDFMELEPGFAIAKTHPPHHMTDVRITQHTLREQYGVVLVAVRRPNGDIDYVEPDFVIPPDVTLIVAGSTEKIQQFATAT